MEKKRDGRLRLIGWLGSLLFHLFLIMIASRLLLQQPRFTVTAGETSTEIELTAVDPEPEAVAPPAPPVPALPPPDIPPISVPPPQVSIPDAFSVPIPPKLPSPRPVVSHPVAKDLAKSHPAHRAATAVPSNASKGAVEAQPDDLHNEPPLYPDESRMAHEEGVVILRVEVTATGDAASVGIKQSSGFFRLDQAARQAVKHWRFHPGLVAGVPVASEADVPVHFRLEQP